MYLYKEKFFNVGDCWTYKYSFIHNGYIKEEYIHCKVLEQIFVNDDLRQIKIKQIHNLEDYLINKNYQNFSERILIVDSSILSAVSQWN